MTTTVCTNCKSDVEVPANFSQPYVKCPACGKFSKVAVEKSTVNKIPLVQALPSSDAQNKTVEGERLPGQGGVFLDDQEKRSIPPVPPKKRIISCDSENPYSGFVYTFLWFGRISRKRFFFGMLIIIISFLICNEIYRSSGVGQAWRGIINNVFLDDQAILICITFGYFAIICMIKRLHDMGSKGIWAFIALSSLFVMDIIFLVVIVPLLVRPGTEEANEFGPPIS